MLLIGGAAIDNPGLRPGRYLRGRPGRRRAQSRVRACRRGDAAVRGV